MFLVLTGSESGFQVRPLSAVNLEPGPRTKNQERSNLEPETRNPEPRTEPEPRTRNPNPEPRTPNPEPSIYVAIVNGTVARALSHIRTSFPPDAVTSAKFQVS